MSDKKDRVIEVATRLFAERGFENTSIANICETANVSKGLIYHHFISKASILIEIFTRTTHKMAAINEESASHLEPRAQLTALIRTLFSQLKNDTLFFQLNLNIMFQPSTRKILEQQIKERATILFNTTKSIFDKISPEKSVELSYMFIAEIDGIALNYLAVFSNYPLAILEKQMLNKYKSID